MKFHQSTRLIIVFSMMGISLFGQAPNLQLTLRYNPTLTRYEVYALPNATQSTFNWGPSQISILAPASVPDAAFTVSLVAGGAWQDNSQVFAPTADPTHDFHGVGSLGILTPFIEGVEKLIFHFTLPGGNCTAGLRLFINNADPNSSAPGMSGGDFSNTIFAIVPGVPAGYETYTGNYNNGGTTCSLPLELMAFQTIANQESIDLIWQTQNELSFDHFELERSTDALNFMTINRSMPQSGISVHYYTYSDSEVEPGITYYYRLKMVDYDGFFVYSDLEHARTSKTTNYEIIRVAPNPTFDKTVIFYRSSEEKVITMILRDVVGKLLETQELLPRKGENECTIDMKRYTPGVYWFALTSGSGQVITKIVRSE